MATMITSECINCGACEPECPNTAIYQGAVPWVAPDGSTHAALSDSFFYIVPEKCTECVGFHDKEACAAVCPVDCCVPNPDIVEVHEVLLARARTLHPDATIPDDAPSRFKAGGAAAPVATAPAAPHEAPVQAAAASPRPAPAAAPPAAAPAKPAAAPAAPPSPPRAAKPALAPAEKPAAVPPPPAQAPAAGTLEAARAIPSLDEWEIPIHCFHCDGDYSAPLASYRAGTVFRCPHCSGSLVPTLSMVAAVRQAVEGFHAEWRAAFGRFREKRRLELEQFEERQRLALAGFEGRLRALVERAHPPGAPRPRRSPFAF